MPELHFCDDCEGCRPAFLDIETGKALPDDHPTMKTALEVWWEVPKEVRRAFIYVTFHNSHDPEYLDLTDEYMKKLTAALATKH